MDKRLSEYLRVGEVDGSKVVKCAICQHVYCSATENYKDHAMMQECVPAERGPLYAESKRFIFREFYCPRCGTLFDTEVRLRGQPFLWDARLES